MNKDILDTLFRKSAAYVDIETLGTTVTNPIHEASLVIGDHSAAFEFLPRPSSFNHIDPDVVIDDKFRPDVNSLIAHRYADWTNALDKYTNDFTQDLIKGGAYKHLFGQVPAARQASYGGVSLLVNVQQGGDIRNIARSVLEKAKDKVLWIANINFEAKHLGLAGDMSGDESIKDLFTYRGKNLKDTMMVNDPGVLRARMVGQTTGDWSGVWKAVKAIDTTVPGIKPLDVQDILRSAQSMGTQLSKRYSLGLELDDVYRGTSLDIQATLMGFDKELHQGVEDNLLSQMIGERTGQHLESIETMLERAHNNTGSSLLAQNAHELDALNWMHRFKEAKNITNPIYARKAVALAFKDKVEAHAGGSPFKHRMSSGHELGWAERIGPGNVSVRSPYAKAKYEDVYDFDEVVERIKKISGNKDVDIDAIVSEFNGKYSNIDSKTALKELDTEINTIGKRASAAVRGHTFGAYTPPVVNPAQTSMGVRSLVKGPTGSVTSRTPSPGSVAFRRGMKVTGALALGVMAFGFAQGLRETELSRVPSKDDAYNTIEGMGEDNYASYLRHQNTDFGSGWRTKKETFNRLKEKPIKFKSEKDHKNNWYYSEMKKRNIVGDNQIPAYTPYMLDRIESELSRKDSEKAPNSKGLKDRYEKSKIALEKSKAEYERERSFNSNKRDILEKESRERIGKYSGKRKPRIKPKVIPTPKPIVKSQATPVMVESFSGIPNNPVSQAIKSAPKGSATSHAVGMSKGMKFGLGIAGAAVGIGLGIMAFSGKGSNSNTIEGLPEQGVAGENRRRNTDFGSPYQGMYGVGLDIAMRLGLSGGTVYVNNVEIDKRITDFRDTQMQTPLQKRIIESMVTKQSLKSMSSTYFLDPNMTTPIASGDYHRYGLNRNKKLQEVSLKDFDFNVEDADTLVLKRGVRGMMGKSMSIRLAGMDSPEVQHSDEAMGGLRIGQGQPHGEESRLRLQAILAADPNAKLIVDPTSDTYGRSLGVIIANGKNVNLQLVQEGAAGSLPFGNPKDDIINRAAFTSAENIAYAGHRGMWQSNYWRAYKQSVPDQNKVTFNTLARVDKLAGNMNLAALYSTMELAEDEGMNKLVYTSAHRLKPKIAAMSQKKVYKDNTYKVSYRNDSKYELEHLKLEITNHMNQYGNEAHKLMKSRNAASINTNTVVDSLTKSSSIYHSKKSMMLQEYEEEAKDKRKLQGYLQRSANNTAFQGNRI